MSQYINQRRISSGFTLIELMIAITISAILLNGVIQMFLSSKQSYRTADGIGRMQENARYAMDTLAFDLRQSGFSPCRKTDVSYNLLNDKTKEYDSNTPLVGFEGGASVFDAPIPGVGTVPGSRLAGSDAIRVLVGEKDPVTVEDIPAAQAAALHLSNLSTISPGEIILICDGEKSTTVQITNSNASTVTVVHNTGGSQSPGNCSNNLTAACGDSPEDADEPYGPGAQLTILKPVIYFIGPSLSNTTPGRTAPPTNSLYRIERRVSGGNLEFTPPQELVEGIETMQIVYGEALSSTTEAVRYVAANDVTDFNNVVSIRIGILFHTPEEITKDADNVAYNVVGTTVTTTGAVSYPADRRQRYVFSETIKVRNRGVSVAPPSGGAAAGP